MRSVTRCVLYVAGAATAAAVSLVHSTLSSLSRSLSLLFFVGPRSYTRAIWRACISRACATTRRLARDLFTLSALALRAPVCVYIYEGEREREIIERDLSITYSVADVCSPAGEQGMESAPDWGARFRRPQRITRGGGECQRNFPIRCNALQSKVAVATAEFVCRVSRWWYRPDRGSLRSVAALLAPVAFFSLLLSSGCLYGAGFAGSRSSKIVSSLFASFLATPELRGDKEMSRARARGLF